MDQYAFQANQAMNNANALGHGCQTVVEAPTLRGLTSRLEELHKEADGLLSLAGDLVGHEPTKEAPNLHPVAGNLVDQLSAGILSLQSKLASARMKFQRGHG